MNRQQGLYAARSASQHGQIIILTVLILALGTGFLVYSMAQFHSIDYPNNAKTDAALALARDALLGRALSDANHPGSLPCPDVDDDGKLTLGVDFTAGGACTQYIGRLPWKTLELPELRDGDGEHLWYALSPVFSDTTTNAINTDSIGSITAYSGSNTSVVSSRAVAVVFSPGAPIGTQARSPTQTAACPMTGTTIAQSLCPNNYLDLETVSGINNANATGPYITVPANATFNDRLLVVSDSVDSDDADRSPRRTGDTQRPAGLQGRQRRLLQLLPLGGHQQRLLPTTGSPTGEFRCSAPIPGTITTGQMPV